MCATYVNTHLSLLQYTCYVCMCVHEFPLSFFMQVGVVCEVASDLARKDDASPDNVRDNLSDLATQLPLPVKQMATKAAYSPHLSRSRSPVKPPPQRSDTMDALKTRASKRVSIETGRSPVKSSKKRSSSTSNLSQLSTGGSYSSGSRTATRSISPNQMIHTHSFVIIQSPPGSQNSSGNFQIPSEVLILPISKENAANEAFHEPSTAALWDFALLSQDEVGCDV